MNQETIDKQLKIYFRQVRYNLKVIHSPKQVKQMMLAIQQSASSYFDENPSATFEDFKRHFGEPEDISIDCINENNARQLNTYTYKKRLFIFIAVLAFTLSIILGSLCFKSYLDSENAMISYQKTTYYNSDAN